MYTAHEQGMTTNDVKALEQPGWQPADRSPISHGCMYSLWNVDCCLQAVLLVLPRMAAQQSALHCFLYFIRQITIARYLRRADSQPDALLGAAVQGMSQHVQLEFAIYPLEQHTRGSAQVLGPSTQYCSLLKANTYMTCSHTVYQVCS